MKRLYLKKRIYFSPSLILLYFLFFSSCRDNVLYEQHKQFKDGNWYYDSVVVFEWNINRADHTSYDIYYTVMNTMKYPYYNLYMRYNFQTPLHTEFPKANLVENFLMHKQTGSPFGKIQKGIYNHEFLLLKDYLFENTGTYRLTLQQYMRLDTLPHVGAVGVKIIKRK